MSDKGQQEPSMEEILASIRRIISEDGEPNKAGEVAAMPTAPAMAPPPPPPPSPPPPPPPPPVDDDVLELTQMLDDDDPPPPPARTPEPDPWADVMGDEDIGRPVFGKQEFTPEPVVMDEPEPEPEPVPVYTPPRRPAPVFDDFEDEAPPPPRPRTRGLEVDEALISRRVADDASHHFTHLARKLGDDLSIGPMPIGVRTVEEVVRELLRPLLKEWLDENLPTIVERLVQQEIDRMIRHSQNF